MRRIPLVVLAVTAGVTLPPAANATAPAPAASWGNPRVVANHAPEFTSPSWLPLRRPAKVSCVKTNCRVTGERNHGHWAIDFLGSRGDPIYAAGYGVAHVGARFNGCARGKAKRGNWVWVDHGAGEITAYTHLHSISIYEGQPVTPATILGRMGKTGTCGPNYLHFERRLGGLHGDYQYPGIGVACLRGRQRQFPAVLGYRNWNQLPIRPMRKAVWSEGVGCSWAPRAVATPAAFTLVRRWRTAAKVTWAPIWGGGARYAISVRKFQKTTGRWGPPRYRYTKRATMVVRGLRPHQHYRVGVAASRGGATSPWTAPVTVRPVPR